MEKHMSYHGVRINNWNNVKKNFMLRYKGKTERNAFVHQMPKLVQEKNETVHDFAERYITEMRELTKQAV
jgi:hypothetical protein